MHGTGSIFLDFNLPNAATWFYFALLLAVGMFFKFGRLLSIRNVDVVGIFLLVPGLLILHEAYAAEAAVRVALLGTASEEISLAFLPRSYWFGYLWLLVVSGLLFLRCLLDLALERRPALGPNLNFGGLVWMAGALMVCLVAVAIRNPAGPAQQVGRRSATITQTQQGAENLVERELPVEAQTRGDIAFWVERGLALLGHVAIVVGLLFIGWKHFHDLEAGMAAATLYLLVPYTAYHVTQVHHVLPGAAVLWAVALYRTPTFAGIALSLGVACPYFPVLLFPLWCGFYRGRGVGRFAVAFFLVAAVLWMTGDLRDSLWSTMADWSSPSNHLIGFWSGMRWAWAYRLPLFVAYVAFALALFFWPVPKNLAHLLALSAALLLGIQFWYADQGGVYIHWYLPLVLLMAFRPNLVDRRPLTILEDADWIARGRRLLTRLVTSWLRPADRTIRVP